MSETATAEAPDAEADTIDAGEEESTAQEARNYESLDENYQSQEAPDSWDSTEAKEASLEALSGKGSKVQYKSNSKAKTNKDTTSDTSMESKDIQSLSLEDIINRSPVETIEEFLEDRHYSLKEIWYILKGFMQGTDSEDEIYQRIDEIAGHGSPTLVLIPGLGSFPLSGKNMKKYSGFNTIRIPRFGPDKTHEVLSYIMDKTHVGAIVAGFSDGEKDFHKYLSKYGDQGLVSAFYGIGSDKGKVETLMKQPSRVFYINGENDKLAPGFDRLLGRYDRGYGAPTSRPIYTIPNATHASLVDRDAKAVGDIISITASGKYFNFDNTRINLN